MNQTNSNTTNYVIYTRKSSDAEDKQVLSIPSQIEELNKTAQQENLHIVDILKESHSAKAPGRPIFNQMLGRIKKGEINGILIWSANRLSRNSVDTGEIIYQFDLKNLVEVRTPNQIFRNTPNDKFLLNLFCSQAKLENDTKGVDVKRGLKKKAEMGWFPGVAKPGYMNEKLADKGTKRILKDPERFPLIKKVFKLMLTGLHTPPQILDKLNNEWGYRSIKRKKLGGKPLARSTIYTILTDPFYYGYYEYPQGSGNWTKGQHEPMITEEEYWRIQKILGKDGRPRPQKRNFAFTGLLQCGECGAAITAEKKDLVRCSKCKTKFSCKNRNDCPKCNTSIHQMKKPKIHHYVYYHCTKRKNNTSCSQGAIELHELEKQINETLNSITISERLKDWVIKQLKTAHKTEVGSRETVQKSQQKEFNQICQRLDRLVDMRANNELSEEEYLDKKSKYMKDKIHYQELMNDTGERQNQWLELTEKTFNFACYAKYHFENGDLETKKTILSALGSKLILKDKKMLISLHEHFFLVKKSLPQLEAENNRFETQTFALEYTKSAFVMDGFCTKLPERGYLITTLTNQTEMSGLVNKIKEMRGVLI